MNRGSLVVGVLLAAAATLAQAQTERERIVAERAAANARFAEQERACNERFIVTSCVEAARREQRQTLTRLHRAELVLDETERRDAAARRREMINDSASAKAAQAARAASEPAESPLHTVSRRAPQPNPPAADRPRAAASAAAERQAIEQRNEAAFAARARAAQAHRETVERRNAERLSDGKQVAPLPLPSGASAP